MKIQPTLWPASLMLATMCNVPKGFGLVDGRVRIIFAARHVIEAQGLGIKILL